MEILQISVEIGDRTHELDLEADLEVTEVTLNDECMRQAGLYARAATLHAAARYQRRQVETELRAKKAELKTAMAKASDEVRENITRLGEKVTEKRIEVEAPAQPCYQAIQLDIQVLEGDVSEALYHEELLDAAREAFNHKKDMLVTLGANLRSESAHLVRINKQRAKEKVGKAVRRRPVRKQRH